MSGADKRHSVKPRYTIRFDLPMPVDLFVAILEGITARYPTAELHFGPDVPADAITITLPDEVAL